MHPTPKHPHITHTQTPAYTHTHTRIHTPSHPRISIHSCIPTRQGDLYLAAYRDFKADAYAKAEASGRVFDIVNIQWLRDCEEARTLLPVK